MLGNMRRSPITCNCYRRYTAALLALLATCAQAEVTTGMDADAGLPYWELREPGMSVRLVQRHPDQTRAFFLARGFSSKDVELIAQSCVFQTVFKNTASATSKDLLEYDLRTWRVHQGGQSQAMRMREDWAQVWADRAVATPARIAFEWALFPTTQIYHPGDYNWGMSVFGLPPDSHFDLTLSWQQAGTVHNARIPDLHCAADKPAVLESQ